MISLLPDPQYTAPSAAAGVSISVAANWVNSAYAELIAATDAACILTGVVPALVSIAAGAGHGLETDIATGAAAAEVVIATFRSDVAGSSAGSMGQYLSSVIGIDNIVGGARVSARQRGGSLFAGDSFRVSITYLKKPLAGSMLTTAQPLLCTPAASNPLNITPGDNNWASGGWEEIEAATSAAWVIPGLAVAVAAATVKWELDLGTGAAGVEVVATTLRGETAAADSLPNYMALWNPLDNIAAATRVSGRARCNANAIRDVRTALAYFEKPL